MSELPQRRKTSEEIACLRESLGVSDVPVPSVPPIPAMDAPSVPPVNFAVENPSPQPGRHPAVSVLRDVKVNHVGTDITTGWEPPILPEQPKWVHSLKKSEQGPVAAAVHKRENPPTGRWVHSLRKSEQGPVVVPEIRPAADDSKLPVARHSERELLEMKRRGLMTTRPPVPYLRSITAHPVLLVLGYLLALAGGVGGLAVALFIALRKRRSRHHAGFITAIAVMVLVFGTIQSKYLLELWQRWFPGFQPE